LPPVGAPDQLRAANGDQGLLQRARSNPLLLVGIVTGVLLLLAWIGWAIYVTSSNGATAGLGVVIAWPAMLAALGLISLPFIGGYLLVRRLSEDSGSTARAAAVTSETEKGEETDGDDEGPEDSAAKDGQEEAEEEDEDEEESDDDSESDAEAKAAKS
jgi:hypothetical protein